jgi:DNA-binding IclR family transcriptional regulator
LAGKLDTDILLEYIAQQNKNGNHPISLEAIVAGAEVSDPSLSYKLLQRFIVQGLIDRDDLSGGFILTKSGHKKLA